MINKPRFKDIPKNYHIEELVSLLRRHANEERVGNCIEYFQQCLANDQK